MNETLIRDLQSNEPKPGRYPKVEDAIAFLVSQGAKSKGLSMEHHGKRGLRILGALDRLRKTHIIIMEENSTEIIRRPVARKEAT